MPYILINNKSFEETRFDSEAELEEAAVANQKYIFGENVVLIDYKLRTGSKDSRNVGIPDGFLIDFSNPNKPQLFFVEYELESHDLYDHIGPQVMRFYASFETGKEELYQKLLRILNDDSALKAEIKGKIKHSPFENLDSLVHSLIYDGNIGIIIVIDEPTADFNTLLSKFSEVPEVAVLKKYQLGKQIVYQYTPFREGVPEGPGVIERKEVDTIVCPAEVMSIGVQKEVRRQPPRPVPGRALR